MSDDDPFVVLLERIQALTGLSQRDAAKVAMQFEEGEVPTAPMIIQQAQHLGYDVEAKTERQSEVNQSPIAEISMNPATVLTEVYFALPRVMCREFPRLGHAPNEALPLLEQMDLPDDIRALLVKIDLFEGKATIWLRDEANDIDRPIGPIDLSRFDSGDALQEGILTLAKRLPLVLRADYN